MKESVEIEELKYVKEGTVEDTLYLIFQNADGDLRAVEACKVNLSRIDPGETYRAQVKRVGCSNRIIEYFLV